MDGNKSLNIDTDVSSSGKQMSNEDLDLRDGKKSPIISKGCGGSNDEFKVDTDSKEDPKVGMTFDTTKEAYDFYNRYARHVGFSVRILRTSKSRSNKDKIQRQVLVCSCEGTSRKVNTPEKRRESRRFECKANFVINLVPGDKYRLIEFKSEHTHDLVPLQHAHYLRSHRKIDFSQAELMNKMRASGIRPGQIFSYMSEEAGGAQHLNFTKSDCNNLLQRTRAQFFKKGDAECLLEYFRQKKGENKHFFYSFRTREDGEICGVFFCDAKSRRDYGLFGDAICFDTTFRTNNYDMLCAPIVGVNHHGQTTLFGCGLLDGETIDAVMWLFTTFFEAMGGKKPKSIFTDQSAAISNVVDSILPEAHHGLCLWHLFQNAAKNLGNNGYKSFASQFKACMYEPETVEEFEKSWDKMLEDNDLRGNEWLQRTYALRKKWAQVYSHAHFCAGMTTSQRSESINKFLKEYFNQGRIVLREFVSLYSRAMDNRREKEREAEYLTQQTAPNLICKWPVESEAAKKYTKKIFYLFQEGIKEVIDLSLELENDDGSIQTYRVEDIDGRQRIRTLTYNHLEQTVSCTCRKFEFSGILCSHALKLFRHLGFKSLPAQYYLNRWTRAATYDVICDPMGEIIPNDNNPIQTAHYSELSHISQRIVSKGSRCPEFFLISKSLLLEVEGKIEALDISSNKNLNKSSTIYTHHDLESDMHQDLQLRNPTKKRLKGSSSQRIKGPMESNSRKKKSSKVKDGKTDDRDVTRFTTLESLKSNRVVQTGISEMAQQAYYNNNNWQWMHCGGMYPHAALPNQGVLYPWNVVASQQRPICSNDFSMSQEASSFPMGGSVNVSGSQHFSSSSASKFTNEPTSSEVVIQ